MSLVAQIWAAAQQTFGVESRGNEEMTMLNYVLTIPRKERVEIIGKPFPRIGEGFVLIKVEIAPICAEQRNYFDWTFEYLEKPDGLGHEGVGEIVEVKRGSKFSVGDRVMIFPYWGCGSCYVCSELRGSPSHCQNLGTMEDIEAACGSESGGYGFSQYRIAPESMLASIPEGLSYKHAAAGNCLLGCTFSAMEENNVQAGDYVLVGGVGFLGLAFIVNAKYRNCRVIVLGRNPARMAMCGELGADWIIDPDDPDWLDRVHAITGKRRGADICFEASGSVYYQQKCLQAVRPYGTVNLHGYVACSDERFPLHVEKDILTRHVTINGSFDVRYKDRLKLIEMLGHKEIQRAIDIMVTHQLPMSQADEAFRIANSKRAGKVYLLPQE